MFFLKSVFIIIATINTKKEIGLRYVPCNYWDRTGTILKKNNYKKNKKLFIKI